MSNVLPKNYLSKAGGQWRSIRILDISIMLYAALQAMEDNEIGWSDTHESIDSMLAKLNYVHYVEPRLIEALLWSCNMLNEKGKWKDIKGRTFQQFVDDVINGKGKWDPIYGTIEWFNARKED